MKIGLFTLHDYNFGSALQCYATQEYVSERFCTCELISYYSAENRALHIAKRLINIAYTCMAHPSCVRSIIKTIKSQKHSNLTITPESEECIKQFIQQFINPKNVNQKSLYKIGSSTEYLAFLTGSDQVWNGSRIDSYSQYFLLFAPKNKRIAWAVSFGGNEIAKYNEKKYRKYISTFAALSVRESSGAEIISHLTGKDATILPDPVILLPVASWRERYTKYSNGKINQQQKYMLLFFIDRISDKALSTALDLLGNEGLIAISFAYSYEVYKSLPKWHHVDGTPWDFLRLIDNASIVLTDSYHATVFSAMFDTSFYSFSRNYQHNQDQSNRITSFLEQIGMLARFNPRDCKMDLQFDDRGVKQFLQREENRSKAFLSAILPTIQPDNRAEKNKPYQRTSVCCGCGACADACATHAVTMKYSGSRGIYPFIDGSLCVDCGACHRVCAMEQQIGKSAHTKRAYIGYWDNTRVTEHSASGGVFAMLADCILCRGGVVYGAAIQRGKDGKLECHHICADNHSGLGRIQGSKYVQSKTEGIFRDVRAKLERGMEVLFSGTSCQVAALYSYLGKQYDKLYTIDLICHGVPGSDLLDDYIAFVEKKESCRVIDLSFRRKDKRHLGESKLPYVLTFLCQDIRQGRQYERIIPLRNSAYYRMFMSYSGYRDCCYSCRYASPNKPSDITVGDYYIDSKRLSELDSKQLLSPMQYHSCVLTNTEKGRKLLLGSSGFVSVEISIAQAVADHEQLQRPSRPTLNGTMMLNLYKRKGFDGLQRYVNHSNLLTAIPRLFKRGSLTTSRTT